MIEAVGTRLAPGDAAEPAKVREAAGEFEALLLAQLLRGMREGAGGWGLGSGESDCATEFAEQQLALALAQRGGLGLGAQIAKAFEPRNRP